MSVTNFLFFFLLFFGIIFYIRQFDIPFERAIIYTLSSSLISSLFQSPFINFAIATILIGVELWRRY